MKKYFIGFDFDTKGDPPSVFICLAGGTQIIEVFEEPKRVSEMWSWEWEDWEPGPLAEKVLDLLEADNAIK